MTQRKVLVIVAGCGLALLIGAALLVTQQQLHRLGVQWQAVRITSEGVYVQQPRWHRRDAQTYLSADALRWRPGWSSHLDIDGLDVHIAGKSSAEPGNDWALDDVLSLLAWLPGHIQVKRWQAHLPCAQGRCALTGDSQLRLQRTSASMVTTLDAGEHHLTLDARAERLTDQHWQVSAQLLLDSVPRGSLELAWQGGEEPELNADLLLDIDQEGPWLSQWLASWTLAQPPQWQAPEGRISLGATWREDATQALGHLAIALPDPWPVPQLGLLAGQLSVDIQRQNTQWQVQGLNGALQLDTASSPWLAPVLDGGHDGQIEVRMTSPSPQTINLAVTSTGDALALDGDIQLDLTSLAQRQLHGEFNLSARAARLSGAAAAVRQTRLQLSGNAKLAENGLEVNLTVPSLLSIGQGTLGDAALHQAVLHMGALHLAYAADSWTLSGPLSINAQLHHPALIPQAWQAQGTLHANAVDQRWDGTLSNATGLSATGSLEHSDGALDSRWTFGEVFFRAGNPLAATFSQWPESLIIDGGRLNAQATVKQQPGAPFTLNAHLTPQSLSGLYQRGAFNGASGLVEISWRDGELKVGTHAFAIAEIQAGLALGPALFSGTYNTRTASAEPATFTLEQAELTVLGGRLWLEQPLRYRSAQPASAQVRLEGLELQQVFASYPAEGLAGSGVIDGQLPLRINQGVSVVGGELSARAPGGYLRFDSPRLRALGQGNAAMKLVTDALRDFRYDTLSSTVDYDVSGALILGLRLHGQNPTLQQGRAIHLNVTLEEDVPALLTSLQLSGKVNETLRQRLEQYWQQRSTPSP